MIQLQALNKVLLNKSLHILTNNNIDAAYFSQYADEYAFIVQHYSQYGNVPDDHTILEQFPEFQLIEVTETDRYIIEALQEDYTYYQAVPILNSAAELMSQDANEAVKFLLPRVQKLLESTNFTGGIDIAGNARQRLDWYRQLKENTELLGISTGLDELDIIVGGWLPGEELVIIAGRPNQGKSWILDFFLAQAWLRRKKVLLYSGEMSTSLVAARTDTIISGISNKAINRAGLDSVSEQAYESHLNVMQDAGVEFIVITPEDLGGRYLTASALEGLIHRYKPDIVGIDQLSLVDDERNEHDPLRIQIAHITQDLFKLSTKYKVPILLDVQAGRSAKNNDDSVPDLENLNESDAIGQNASRVITLVQSKDGLKIAVKKNRYGDNNITLTYYWDIDKCKLTFMPASEENEEEVTGRNNSERSSELRAKNRSRRQETEEQVQENGTEAF